MPSFRDLSNPGIEPRSPALQVVSLLSEPPGEQLYGDNQVGISPWAERMLGLGQVSSGPRRLSKVKAVKAKDVYF